MYCAFLNLLSYLLLFIFILVNVPAGFAGLVNNIDPGVIGAESVDEIGYFYKNRGISAINKIDNGSNLDPIISTAYRRDSKSSVSATFQVWANNGEDKVTQDEQRATADPASVLNSLWDGEKITIFGARNEVVSFNMVIEASIQNASNVKISFNRLTGPGGSEISSRTSPVNDLFDWRGRNIELFYIRYLQIKGLSLLSYNALYDERHVPERFRRPYTGEGDATGTWADRPDHDKFYPDIAVPLELENPFDISAGQNQSIWVDIYIPKTATPGLYKGVVAIDHDGAATQNIPVELAVRSFSLPDYPSAPTMLYYSSENINYRYFGSSYLDPSSEVYQQSLDLADIHFQMAHRHKISLIDDGSDITQISKAWADRLNGDLFTASREYDGPGIAIGNNVFSIGTYSSWSWNDDWDENSRENMWNNTDAWVNWFDGQSFTTETEYFLYLIDESDDYIQTEQWARWMDENPGPGSRLMSMATISSPEHWENSTPSLDIPTSGIDVGITDLWENATLRLVEDPTKRFYYYNGARPASGSFCTEDDGVALRVNGWIQHKKKIDRWFYWESTYYNNYQGEEGQTDLFKRAQTYGSFEGIDNEYARGESGWNYTNGDGVLFYPGTDSHYPQSSYGVSGPFASLRLKHWRRGIQDADYLALAKAVDQKATSSIVKRMIPAVLWENGVENEEDPTYVYTDISWPTDPDLWEAARRELADIIEGSTGKVKSPAPDIKANGLDGTVVINSNENLVISISLDAADHMDETATWWVLKSSPTGAVYYYDLLKGSLAEGSLPIYQGGLLSFSDLPLLTSNYLQTGTHTYYFGVYMDDSNSEIKGELFYDSVVLLVN